MDFSKRKKRICDFSGISISIATTNMCCITKLLSYIMKIEEDFTKYHRKIATNI